MGLLDDLGASLQAAVDWTFSDAVLVVAGAKTPNGMGGFTSATANHNCRAKVDRKEARNSDGGIVYTTRVLILKGSLAVTPAPGNDVTGLDRAYRLRAPIVQDGLGSHWVCEVENG